MHMWLSPRLDIWTPVTPLKFSVTLWPAVVAIEEALPIDCYP